MNTFLHIITIVFFLMAIVLICEVFTNAVENLGKAFNIGSNAVGSIFAAIGTALPETIVPLVAILGAYLTNTDIKTGSDVCTGAILGSSFLISTFAMFMTGLTIFCVQKNKIALNNTTSFLNDLRFFFPAYIVSIFTIFITNEKIKYLIPLFLILYYLFYATKTLKEAHGKCKGDACELHMNKLFKLQKITPLIFIQLIISLSLLIVVAKLFINEITYFSNVFNIQPFILSLIISPLATELPEITNGVLWAKNNKNDLALSNLSGALVFQATIPMAIGIALTKWQFNYDAIVNVTLVLLATLVLYSKAKFKEQLEAKDLIFCGIFYLIFIVIIVFNKTIL
ncbi:MAG: hypothetical protein E7Z91_02070 [Cyanobacteria bacterium SIG30]|nr:hypothetical protein [Cyanobacteria bacterium SIG30]